MPLAVHKNRMYVIGYFLPKSTLGVIFTFSLKVFGLYRQLFIKDILDSHIVGNLLYWWFTQESFMLIYDMEMLQLWVMWNIV